MFPNVAQSLREGLLNEEVWTYRPVYCFLIKFIQLNELRTLGFRLIPVRYSVHIKENWEYTIQTTLFPVLSCTYTWQTQPALLYGSQPNITVIFIVYCAIGFCSHIKTVHVFIVSLGSCSSELVKLLEIHPKCWKFWTLSPHLLTDSTPSVTSQWYSNYCLCNTSTMKLGGR